MIAVSAWVFVVVAAVVVAFQLALIAGAPWGHLTQGGELEGSLPPARRAAAGLSAVLMVVSAGIVLARAGVALPNWQGWVPGWVWGVVALSALTVAANAISRSRAERALWLPIGLALLATSLFVALRAG